MEFDIGGAFLSIRDEEGNVVRNLAPAVEGRERDRWSGPPLPMNKGLEPAAVGSAYGSGDAIPRDDPVGGADDAAGGAAGEVLVPAVHPRNPPTTQRYLEFADSGQQYSACCPNRRPAAPASFGTCSGVSELQNRSSNHLPEVTNTRGPSAWRPRHEMS